jgi:putative nucleotidyltransferase with HDIG domain
MGAPLILFSVDTKGTFTLIEGQVLHKMGADPKMLLGRSIEDMFPDRADIIGNIDRALSGESFTSTVVFDPMTFSTSYSPQFDKDGRVIGVIGVSTDVTEQTVAENQAERLVCELEEANQELAHAYDSTIQGWSAALDLRDRETEGHSRRVTEVTVLMARAMGLSDAEIVHIRRGALLHDIGKMGIPDAILLKPGPLTDDEWVIMRKHPEYAYSLLSGIDFLRPALDIPLYHHEKWDGTGYPHRLQGADIPLSARIFAIVDVWDALSSDRPYRAAWAPSKVMDHLRSLAGTHFDPAVVDVFADVIAEHTFVRQASPGADLAKAA